MSDYWQQYWNRKTNSSNPQIQVGRTKYGEPISEGQLNREIESLIRTIGIEANDIVIDLCCGNGSITRIIAEKARRILAVDYSKPLLDLAPKNLPNVEFFYSDARKFNFNEFNFNKLIWLFSIQHFTLKESAVILKKAIKSIPKGGRILIADVPDMTKKFDFFEGEEAVTFYFDKLTSFGCPIGTWYDQNWFISLGFWLKASKVEIIQKPNFHFNHQYRFDVIIEK